MKKAKLKYTNRRNHDSRWRSQRGVLGFVVGFMFGGPIGGLLVGGVAGALLKKTDYGVGVDKVKAVGEGMANNSSALLVQIESVIQQHCGVWSIRIKVQYTIWTFRPMQKSPSMNQRQRLTRNRWDVSPHVGDQKNQAN